MASSVSSYASTFLPGGSFYPYVVSTYRHTNNREYAYAVLSGTSMSSPAVSSVVAMMLQAKPDLTPEEVRSILVETAIRDQFTGSLPPGGNNNWGNGKVNAYGAMKKLAMITGIPGFDAEEAYCRLYPNPSAGSFTLEYRVPAPAVIRMEISDLSGRQLLEETWEAGAGMHARQIKDLKLSPGMYLTRITWPGSAQVIRTLIQE